jgi:hypothetical protein
VEVTSLGEANSKWYDDLKNRYFVWLLCGEQTVRNGSPHGPATPRASTRVHQSLAAIGIGNMQQFSWSEAPCLARTDATKWSSTTTCKGAINGSDAMWKGQVLMIPHARRRSTSQGSVIAPGAYGCCWQECREAVMCPYGLPSCPQGLCELLAVSASARGRVVHPAPLPLASALGF